MSVYPSFCFFFSFSPSFSFFSLHAPSNWTHFNSDIIQAGLCFPFWGHASTILFTQIAEWLLCLRGVDASFYKILPSVEHIWLQKFCRWDSSFLLKSKDSVSGMAIFLIYNIKLVIFLPCWKRNMIKQMPCDNYVYLPTWSYFKKIKNNSEGFKSQEYLWKHLII